jgi:glycosyltransferase involved in cell wall biosynthesis
MKKKAFIGFLGNINYDSRGRNLIKSLEGEGFEVTSVSFEWIDKEGGSKREGNHYLYKLVKTSSILFYFKFAALLKKHLLLSKATHYFAEDIYSLPFVYFFAKMKGGKVYYDARELFGYLAGLKDKKFIQKMLRGIEKRFIGKADVVMVTGEMDKEFLMKEYGINNIIVLRNLPLRQHNITPIDYREKYNIDKKKIILIYQGVILHGRGIKLLYAALKRIPEAVLIIIGDGEYKNYYERLAQSEGLNERVFFTGKIEQDQLFSYSAGGDIGTALIENLSLSYYYALPNKLFEYIQAGVPSLVSNFPQMKKVVEDYGIGRGVDPEKEDEIAEIILSMISDEKQYQEMKDKCRGAAEELNWEKEFQILKMLL